METKHPAFATTVVKSVIESTPVYKWMKVGMSVGDSGGGAKAPAATGTTTATGLTEEEHDALTAPLYAQHPDIAERYHIILLPRASAAVGSDAPLSDKKAKT